MKLDLEDKGTPCGQRFVDLSTWLLSGPLLSLISFLPTRAVAVRSHFTFPFCTPSDSGSDPTNLSTPLPFLSPRLYYGILKHCCEFFV